MIKTELRFHPDYAVPPGATLRETIEIFGISQAELARRTGRPVKTINEIFKGRASITPGTALQFERVLGIPASFWINREKSWVLNMGQTSKTVSLVPPIKIRGRR